MAIAFAPSIGCNRRQEQSQPTPRDLDKVAPLPIANRLKAAGFAINKDYLYAPDFGHKRLRMQSVLASRDGKNYGFYVHDYTLEKDAIEDASEWAEKPGYVVHRE